jgi:hypothetical protein
MYGNYFGDSDVGGEERRRKMMEAILQSRRASQAQTAGMAAAAAPVVGQIVGAIIGGLIGGPPGMAGGSMAGGMVGGGAGKGAGILMSPEENQSPVRLVGFGSQLAQTGGSLYDMSQQQQQQQQQQQRQRQLAGTTDGYKYWGEF